MHLITYLLGQNIHLLGLQSSVCEHTDLRCDVAPVVLAAELLQVLLQERTHGDNAVSHVLDLAQPLLVELGVVQDLRSNAGAVDGRVGVERADKDLDLRVNTLLLLGRFANDGESTDTLAVETLLLLVLDSSLGIDWTYHVLGEALGEDRAETLLDEVAESKSILVSVATGKALVGHVEEGEVVALLDGVGNLLPLVLGGVNAGRVVSASMEKHDAALGHGLDVGDHSIEVEADGVLVVVAVLLDLQAGVLEDGIVVGPRGSGDVDGLCARIEALEEGTANAQSTGTGDGLGDDDAALLDRSRIGAVGELESSLCEGRHTSDAGVFLVERLVDDGLLGLLHGREDERLALVVTVGTDTWVC